MAKQPQTLSMLLPMPKLSEYSTAEGAAWNWAHPAAGTRGGHVHVRREDAELVVIVTGSAGGAIAGRLGGLRMTKAAGEAMARFILTGAADV